MTTVRPRGKVLGRLKHTEPQARSRETTKVMTRMESRRRSQITYPDAWLRLTTCNEGLLWAQGKKEGTKSVDVELCSGLI